MTFKPVEESDLPRFSHGKGDSDRISNKKQYDNNYTRLFGEKIIECPNCKVRVDLRKYNSCPWCDYQIVYSVGASKSG